MSSRSRSTNRKASVSASYFYLSVSARHYYRSTGTAAHVAAASSNLRYAMGNVLRCKPPAALLAIVAFWMMMSLGGSRCLGGASGGPCTQASNGWL